jgi:hypothetical protein
MACDGSYAVSRGAWRDGGRAGWFITVWQRQPRGDYKWVLDQGGDASAPVAAPEFIMAKVAECPQPRRGEGATVRAAAAPVEVDWLSGRSTDGTLVWTTGFEPGGAQNGAREFAVRLRTDGAMVEVAQVKVGGG